MCKHISFRNTRENLEIAIDTKPIKLEEGAEKKGKMRVGDNSLRPNYTTHD